MPKCRLHRRTNHTEDHLAILSGARLQPRDLARFDEDLLLLIRCHAAAFEALGGAPRDVLDGPMDTAVIGEGEIGGFIADEPFAEDEGELWALNHSRGARFHSSAAWLRTSIAASLRALGK